MKDREVERKREREREETEDLRWLDGESEREENSLGCRQSETGKLTVCDGDTQRTHRDTKMTGTLEQDNEAGNRQRATDREQQTQQTESNRQRATDRERQSRNTWSTERATDRERATGRESNRNGQHKEGRPEGGGGPGGRGGCVEETF